MQPGCFGGEAEDFFEGGKVEVLDLLKSDTALANADVAEFFFVRFRDVFAISDGADVQTHILLLIRERNHGPLNHLLLIVFVGKRPVPDHVVRKMRLELGDGFFDELMDL